MAMMVAAAFHAQGCSRQCLAAHTSHPMELSTPEAVEICSFYRDKWPSDKTKCGLICGDLYPDLSYLDISIIQKQYQCPKSLIFQFLYWVCVAHSPNISFHQNNSSDTTRLHQIRTQFYISIIHKCIRDITIFFNLAVHVPNNLLSYNCFTQVSLCQYITWQSELHYIITEYKTTHPQ